MQEIQSTVNAEPEVNVEPQEVEQPTEVVETPETGEQVESAEGEVATPTQSKTENADFAKVRREAEARAREKAMQEANQRVASIYGDIGIKTIDELEQAVKNQIREQQESELSSRGFSQEEINDIIEAREIKQQDKARKDKEAEAIKLQSEMQELMELFPDADIDNLPQEVIDSMAKGKDMVKAYAVYQAKNIDKIKVKTQQNTLRALKENGDTATGSITGTGAESPRMSAQQVNDLLSSMSSKEKSAWVDKNYSNLEKWGYFKGN